MGENPAVPAAVAVPTLVADNVGPQTPAATVLPMPPPAAPVAPPASPASAAGAHVVLASTRVVSHRAARVASRTGGNSVSHLARSEWAENLPPPRPVYAPSPESAIAAAPATVTDATDTGGSMLGMAADLSPPPLPGGTGN
jgi:hypothetical protein